MKGVDVEDRDQIESEVEETGERTDDESMENKGRAQEAWGEAKEKADDMEDEARDRL
jgi:uncharacterized protein YjbJ (UPF0337 family)